MRTLIYKRTHKGDPDATGQFGVEDCMGQVRSYDFEAVIGVGGIGHEARAEGIAHLVNWIGIGAQKSGKRRRGPLVTFERFHLFEDRGPDFRNILPGIARRLYRKNGPRFLVCEVSEADLVLEQAKWVAYHAFRKLFPGKTLGTALT